jgi:phosphoenolpyruvate synthase/pyruvate phosphate dikinase
MKFVKNLQNISQGDVARVGGKGASLGEMTKMGLPVPPGFVVLTGAFEKFLEENDLRTKIETSLRSVKKNDMRSVEKASKTIRAFIESAEVPKGVADEICEYVKKLGAKSVAVRSSATAEDSVHAAWAGQLESYLPIPKKHVLEQVKKCWASLFTPRAIFYRGEKHLLHQKISVAVVVQKMVRSEASGTVFSVHPVTQNNHELLIEAGHGFGENVVSGITTPDGYVVEKESWRLLNKITGSQENRKKQILSDQEIIALAKLVGKMEKHFHTPLDIEWAKEKKHFFILQSRPITTLRPITSHPQNILTYLKNQKWFFGVRADESLLFYSAKTEGENRVKQAYGIPFAETLLIPLKKNKPIRVFHLEQAKRFHAVSRKKILKNLDILPAFIKKDDATYKNIKAQGGKLLIAIRKNDEKESVRIFHKILSLYEQASAHFIMIFSLGLQLAQIGHVKNASQARKAHDAWRNNVAFKEEALGEYLFSFFSYLTTKKKLALDPLLLMKFLTAHEVKAWLGNKLTDQEMKKKIASRKKHGFVYLHTGHDYREVIDDRNEIKKIQAFFLKQSRESQKSKSQNEISGQVAYDPKKPIKGTVVVVKDKAELQNKSHLIRGRILVAIQTTPHFIPYVRKAKAIITDEGGITCHAAIIARELRIPCLVGTQTATHLLKDDDVVEINMNNGVLCIKK